ncbi:Rossmann-like and DUF2520 domain-containing protein [Namhaeicola litoreus]|uniref:Rossmann-like and DUF2520 domain-containing protein n=1 Tax=Namhaeicola litoreus TaxID=1052145 RepID=A0ABW3Y633_9FLAO
MITVVLIGAGNVAVHMAKAMYAANEVHLIQRYARSLRNQEFFNSEIPFTKNLSELMQADLYLIAINDDEISSFSKKLEVSGLVAHTSGSMALNELQCKSGKGVCYPVQTFSKNELLEYINIPFCLEAENKRDLELLKKFANSISKNVYEINSNQREKLHLAAVFANNFSNHMFKIANDLSEENNFSFDILKPLLLETVKKLNHLSPIQAQTGPARRNDQKVIAKHLKQLYQTEKEIYQVITKSIIKTYS